MRSGDRFPSVRTLSQELKINPNTAHKVVTQLISDGLLEAHPGRGTVVAELPASTARQRTQLLKGELAALVVEARRLQMNLGDVQAALSEHWERLDSDARPSGPGHARERSHELSHFDGTSHQEVSVY